MRSSFLRVAALLLSMGLTSTVHPQATDPLQAIKDTLSSDSGNSLIQGVLGGKTDGTQSDKKLEEPNATLPRSKEEEENPVHTLKREETYDGRVLRRIDEDPELRADDQIIVELTPIGEGGGASANLNAALQGLQAGNGQMLPNGTQAPSPVGAQSALAGLPGLTGLQGALGGNSANPTAGANGAAVGSAATPNPNLPEQKPKTEEEKQKAEKFRKRILANNPYKLTHMGVLELPGMPPIPLAGLTAFEASKRLAADPGLADYQVKVTLLRLLPTGEQALKPFGYDLFKRLPSTFAPVSDIQVPMEYVIGPGDTFRVQLFGNEPAIYELTVQRDGQINFPKIGPIEVSNMNFDSARGIIDSRVSKQLPGSRISVTMGNLREIRVFVLGDAEKPGSYTVSGLSTMTNAIFVSGGVKDIGSLRNIQLKRNGQVVTTLDLYDLLLRGDTSQDRKLLPGDVIFIPPIGKTISIYGAVRRPAIYELKGEANVAQAVTLAGGLLPDADARIGQLERILPSKLRQMLDVDLTAGPGLSTPLADGDKLRVPEMRPTLENSVVLTGFVFRPGQFEYRKGMHLTDVLSSIDELRPNADQHYIMIRREIPPEQTVQVVSADLVRALAKRGSADDPELKARDKIFVFDLSADRARILAPLIRDLELQATPEQPEQVVSVDGRVKAPGHYPLQPDMHVSDLIRAGGSLEDAAFRGEAEITRYNVVDGESRGTQLISVDLTAIHNGDASADIQLKPYDILIIKPIAKWVEPGFIELAGEVRFPGKYPIHQGETLSSVLHRAGGLTDLAFAEGAVYTREALKKREKEQLELLANRLQSDLASLSLEAVVSSAASNNAGGASNGAQALQIGQQLMGQLRDTKPVGRLVIDINSVIKGRPGGPEDVIVRDEDKLIIPKKSQEVTILGEVQSPNSHVFEKGLSRDDYINRSGGTTQKADRKRIYVVRANGDVVSGQRMGWFRRSQEAEIRPGDTIVVPLDTERVRALPIWQSVSTIIYNLAVALLAVHSVQ